MFCRTIAIAAAMVTFGHAGKAWEVTLVARTARLRRTLDRLEDALSVRSLT